jgi:hypothetical protein
VPQLSPGHTRKLKQPLYRQILSHSLGLPFSGFRSLNHGYTLFDSSWFSRSSSKVTTLEKHLLHLHISVYTRLASCCGSFRPRSMENSSPMQYPYTSFRHFSNTASLKFFYNLLRGRQNCTPEYLSFNGLQFAAKLHEVFIAASLS